MHVVLVFVQPRGSLGSEAEQIAVRLGCRVFHSVSPFYLPLNAGGSLTAGGSFGVETLVPSVVLGLGE